jgi:hypothetical protein
MSLTIHQIHYLDTAYERAKNIEYVNKQTYVIRGYHSSNLGMLGVKRSPTHLLINEDFLDMKLGFFTKRTK